MQTRKLTEVPISEFSKETNFVVEIDEEMKRVRSSDIRQLVTDEKDRAQEAEKNLADRIDEETTRAVKAEKTLTDNLASEAARAKAEEKTLATDLGVESSRAQAAEKVLTDNLASEAARAVAAENTLTDNLAAETTRAKAAEKANADSLAAEVIRAKAGEKAVADNLTVETARAKTREDGIAADLAAENNRALNAENALDEDLAVETIRAKAAEKTLTDNLMAETARAEAKETEISGNLSSEITRAKAAEKTLTDNLAAEVTRSKGAEKTLTDNLSAEVTRAKAAEKTNADAITAEASRGQAAEGAIRETVSAHVNNKSNPHGVTKAQAGLGNVPNVSTNDQTPTFTQAATLANIASGEKLAVMLGKIAKALADFIAHKADNVLHITATERTNWNDANSKKHSHSNKTVIDKITQALLDNWTAAFTHISDAVKHITATERTNWNAAHTHVSNKSNPHGVTAAQAGAAPASHTHSYLPLAGGTMTGDLKMKSGDYTATPIKLYAGDVNGAGLVSQAGGLYIAGSGESAQNLYNVLGIGAAAEKTYISSDQDISLVTNCDSIANRKTVIIDNAGKITAPGGFSGTHSPADLSSAVPVSKGGTGATTAAAARTNLGVAASGHTHTKSQITDMPTKVSQFTNDKGYITAADIDTSQNHVHANKSVLDKITQALLDNWNAAYNHVSDTVKHITAAERTNWNTVTNKVDKVSGKQLSTNDYTAAEKTKLAGIAAGANNYVHPTTTGNKHIPTGGASGQFLKWSADGTAIWAADNNTTYSTFKAATASAAGGAGLVPAPAAGAQAKYLRADGTWQTPPNTTYSAATQSANGLMSAADKKKSDRRGTVTILPIDEVSWKPGLGGSSSCSYPATMAGITSSDNILVALDLPNNLSEEEESKRKEAFSYVSNVVTTNGMVTLYCNSKRPQCSFEIAVTIL